MANIKIPEMGESITEGTIASWFKQEGDYVEADEPVVEIETDKVTQEVYAPVAGILQGIQKKSGDAVVIGEVIASVDEKGNKAGAKDAVASQKNSSNSEGQDQKSSSDLSTSLSSVRPVSPAARKIAADLGVDTSQVSGSGKRGTVTKQDLQSEKKQSSPTKTQEAPEAKPKALEPKIQVREFTGERTEEAVSMTRLRRAIADRLLSAQQNAAILTTFNEVDMHNLMEMRKQYKDDFLKKYGVKLGFMGVFTKAVIAALQELPAINAEIRGNEIVYKNYIDVGVAVGGPKGLVVPILRNAHALSIAEIESEIIRLATRVKNNQITLDEMQGGTFTISNGGVYGSMMSTPILNPPQSGILGMHNIIKRPVVVNDEIVIRPMMYTALSYDHRIVDGKEAVTFLVRLKEAIENPVRLLLEI